MSPIYSVHNSPVARLKAKDIKIREYRGKSYPVHILYASQYPAELVNL